MNSAPVEAIRAHLAACDDDFVPPLSDRVDITAYAARIHSRAHRFEGWDGSTLASLIACYVNEESAYITSVSTLPAFRSRGLTSRVLDFTLATTDARGIPHVDLEVSPENEPALRLYERRGFTELVNAATQDEGTVLLRRVRC